MKRIFLTVAIASLLVLPFAFSSSASAFWPFTKGEVKGESTDAKRGFLGLFKPAPVATRSAELSEDAQEDQITATTLTAALKNKNLTEAQVTEIKKRLGEIKAEREKLMVLRKSFGEWLKANGIDRRVLIGGKIEATASGTLNKRPPVLKTIRGTESNKSTRSGQQ